MSEMSLSEDRSQSLAVMMMRRLSEVRLQPNG